MKKRVSAQSAQRMWYEGGATPTAVATAVRGDGHCLGPGQEQRLGKDRKSKRGKLAPFGLEHGAHSPNLPVVKLDTAFASAPLSQG